MEFEQTFWYFITTFLDRKEKKLAQDRAMAAKQERQEEMEKLEDDRQKAWELELAKRKERRDKKRGRGGGRFE